MLTKQRRDLPSWFWIPTTLLFTPSHTNNGSVGSRDPVVSLTNGPWPTPIPFLWNAFLISFLFSWTV